MNKTLVFLLCIFTAMAVGCSSGGDNGGGGNNSGGSGNSNSSNNSDPNMGASNTTDISVTGGVQEVGMTYAEVLTYQNRWKSNDELTTLRAGGYLGIFYGTSPTALTKYIKCSSYDVRTIKTTIAHLEAGKTYYYRAVIGSLDLDFQGQEIGTFTTREFQFNGAMTATADNITFHRANLTGNVNTSSLNEKETFFKGLAYSKNMSDFSDNIYQKLKNAKSENNKYGIIEIVQSDVDYEIFGGFYGNGDMHFVVDGDMKLNVNMQPGNTFYYCPFIIIGGKYKIGSVKDATLRTLPEQTGFVDLGLSVLWDARNLGADTQFDLGNTYTLSKATSLVKQQYGSSAHIPSREEVEELNKCKIEGIDNGVLITGLNGNQIFIPNDELKESNSVQLIDNGGFLTSTSSWSSTFGSSYTYFNFTTDEVKFFTGYSDAARLVRLVSDGGSGGGIDNGTPQTVDDVIGTYTAFERAYDYNEQKWYNYEDYQITITAQEGSTEYLYITNFWDGGKTVEGYFDSTTGTISIFSSQAVYTHETYGDLEVLIYNSEDNSYYEKPLEFTYNTEDGYYKSPIYGLFCSSGGWYPFVTYIKKNLNSASARAQNHQPQLQRKKLYSKPKIFRRR